MRTLILASKSPRRSELLSKAGFKFEIITLEISENLNNNLSLDEALMDLAQRKAQGCLDSGKLSKSQDYLVIGADTVVVVDGEVIGKPSDLEDAKKKLRLLSGQVHLVKTAISIWDSISKRFENSIDTTEVEFGTLTSEEIEKYVREKRPLDKAGAYGVQDVPKNFIKNVIGDIDNVMGLPVKLVEEILARNGWNVDRKTI